MTCPNKIVVSYGKNCILALLVHNCYVTVLSNTQHCILKHMPGSACGTASYFRAVLAILLSLPLNGNSYDLTVYHPEASKR